MSNYSNVNIKEVTEKIKLTTEVCLSYEKIGIKQLYDWQADCLFKTTLLSGGNLVYCAPTSGGKTLVAELIILKTAICQRSKAIFVLPFVSLVLEKEKHMRRLVTLHNRNQAKSDRILVKGFHGDQSIRTGNMKENILICTIEKVNGIINHLISTGHSHKLGCVVIDEMHMLGDAHRGYHLEILISKLRFLEKQSEVLESQGLAPQGENTGNLLDRNASIGGNAISVRGNKDRQRVVDNNSPRVNVQLIALSATMGNIEQLANWFGASLYRTAFRPVPLTEYVKAGNSLLTPSGIVLAELPRVDPKSDPDHVVTFTAQGLAKGQQIMVFCSSRAQCQITCKILYERLHFILLESKRIKNKTITIDDSLVLGEITHEPSRLADELMTKRKTLLAKMQESNSLLEGILIEGILRGVAFHHAGLSDVERTLVEDGFRDGVISVLTATSTLAAGVNLPAGRVLIRSMSIGIETLGVVQYKQMCGRAGRAGKTSQGESFLLVNTFERDRALSLCNAPMPPVSSQMHPRVDGGRGLLKALLELHALGLCDTVRDTAEYLKFTLMYNEQPIHERNEVIATGLTALSFLLSARALDRIDRPPNAYRGVSRGVEGAVVMVEGAVKSDVEKHDLMEMSSMTSLNPDMNVRISRFGRAVVDSGMNPDEAIALYDDLLRAQDSLNLETDLHLCYLVTPLSHSFTPAFDVMWNMWEHSRMKKTPMLAIFEAIGLSESIVFNWCRKPPSSDAIMNCSDKLRLLRIRILNPVISKCDSNNMPLTGNQQKMPFKTSSSSMSDNEWTALHRCRRVWAANALLQLIDGVPQTSVAKTFKVPLGDVQSLLRSAKLTAQRVQRFCGEIGWPPLEKLISNFKVKLDVDISESLKDLLRLPMITPKLASILCEHDTSSVASLAESSPDYIAQLLQLKTAFEVQDLEFIERVQYGLDTAQPSSTSCDGIGDQHNNFNTIPRNCESDVSEMGGVHNEETVQQSADNVPKTVDNCSETSGRNNKNVVKISIMKDESNGASRVKLGGRDEFVRVRMLTLASSLIRSARDFLSNEEAKATSALAELAGVVNFKQDVDGGDSLRPDGGEDAESFVGDDTYSENDEDEEESDEEDGMRGFVGEGAVWRRRAVNTPTEDTAPELLKECENHLENETLVVPEKIVKGSLVPVPFSLVNDRNVVCNGQDDSLVKMCSTAENALMERVSLTHSSLNDPVSGVHIPLRPQQSGGVLAHDAAAAAAEATPAHTTRRVVITRSKLSLQRLSSGNRDLLVDEVDQAISLQHSNVTTIEENSITLVNEHGCARISDANLHQVNSEQEWHIMSSLQKYVTKTPSSAAVKLPSLQGVSHIMESTVFATPLQPMRVKASHQVNDMRNEHTVIDHTSILMPAYTGRAGSSEGVNSDLAVLSGIARKACASRDERNSYVYIPNKRMKTACALPVDTFDTPSDARTAATVVGDDDISSELEEGMREDNSENSLLPMVSSAIFQPWFSHSKSNFDIYTNYDDGSDESTTGYDQNNSPEITEQNIALTDAQNLTNQQNDDDTRVCEESQELFERSNGSQHSHLCADPNQVDIVESSVSNESVSAETVKQLNYKASFLTPFTPSKIATPGKYLYLPQGPTDGFTGRSRSMDVCSTSKAFGWRHLANPPHCQHFFLELNASHCFSFELMFRPLPVATHVSQPFIKRICTTWTQFLVSKPYVACGFRDTSRYAHCSNGSRVDAIGDVLVGISMNFGKDFGYYLPLACPLPSYQWVSPSSTPSDKQSSLAPLANLASLPSTCLHKICRLVGYDSILNRCPAIGEHVFSYLSQNNRTTKPSLQLNTGSSKLRNPLLEVSRRISDEARVALQLEWCVGHVAEWALVADLFANPVIGKISKQMKEKLVVLRGRDVVACGPLEDPSVAISLLTGLPDIPELSTLLRTPVTTGNFASMQSLCFQSVATMRASAITGQYLQRYKLWDLYANIEMQLCICVASMEYHGMPVDSRFYTHLRQDLSDRQKTIEYYFSIIEGKDFNLSSVQHCSRLKKKVNDDALRAIQLLQKAEAGKGNSNLNPVLLMANIDISSHPLMRLLSEWRSHNRCIAMCSSFLGARHKFYGLAVDRIRATFQALGTETGRMVVTSPALQQVPHECHYWRSSRPCLQEEINSHCHQHGSISSLICSIQSKPKEWVRVVSLRALQSIRDSTVNSALSQAHVSEVSSKTKSFTNYSSGRLHAVCEYTIDQPYHAQMTLEANNSYPEASQSQVPSVLKSMTSLADLWRNAGVSYTTADATRINQVSIDIGGHIYNYPADKVFRLAAPLRPSTTEVDRINRALAATPGYWPLVEDLVEDENSSTVLLDYYLINPRDGFHASKGYMLMSADYSQIELRIMGHFSGDPELIKAFSDGVDVFRSLASNWRGKKESEVTEVERNAVKQLCYALLYGAGAQRLSEESGCTIEHAKGMFTEFMTRHKSVNQFIIATKQSCRKNGYVETLCGRRRYLPDINSKDSKKRSRAERQAVNTLCQGSAADLIKLAMVNIHHRLSSAHETEAAEVASGSVVRPLHGAGGGLYKALDHVRLVLQIHDELLFEVPEQQVNQVACIVRDCMENAVELNVPLQVKVKVGSKWGCLEALSLSASSDKKANEVVPPTVRTLFKHDV